MEKNCERCFNKKAIFNCPSCDKYHNLCESCDNFIHSLNKTKYHKRQYIYSYNNEQNENNDYKFNKSYYSNNKIRENTTPSFYKFQTYYNLNYNNKINNNSTGNEYEISSIKNQIEDVQKNMSDQINQILINIDNNNKRLNYENRLREIEMNYKEKINELISNKNKEIK